jgi:hypothetical protein
LSYAAYVLRVLSKQTLETSKEVKDPSVPGPSLVKEVKDSSLTILFSYRLISTVEERGRAQIRRFSAGGAHCWKKISLIWVEEGRSEENLFPGGFARPRAPFLNYYWRVFSAYLFIVVIGRIS